VVKPQEPGNLNAKPGRTTLTAALSLPYGSPSSSWMAIFGMGNLAGFKVAATRGKGPACLSKTFADDVKSRTVMHVVQDMDKFYQENSGKLDTPVIEMVLRRCTKAGPPDTVRRK
jgi:hypothetical protein